MASSLLAMDSNSRQDKSSINWGQDITIDNIEIPKFKSFAPSSISISPSLFSPSNFSPSVFLDSPAFASAVNILASPTTGALISGDANLRRTENREKSNSFSDFCFYPSSGISATTSSSLFQSSSNFVPLEQSSKIQEETWNSAKPTIQNGFLHQKTGEKSELSQIQGAETRIQSGSSGYSQAQSSAHTREQKTSEDGYNWRKYGQKQVKGSENPRSYYKCTFSNCPTKKKVERSQDGQITEIVYKGNHNHQKPQSTKRSSSSQFVNSSVFNDSGASDLRNSGANQMESFRTQEDNFSGSIGDDEFEQQTSHMSTLMGDEDDREPDGKRWKGDDESQSVVGTGSRTVREPRIVVQTTSDIDILIDGYRWRKYGQKVVKGNPNPRSYYKCTSIGCPVRKHVERASHDMRAVITTYEGKHNHDVPAERGSAYATTRHLSDHGNTVAPLPVRPSAFLNSNHSNPVQRSSQTPYTLEMLQNQNHPVGDFWLAGAKEEPNHDSFFDSFLS